jgi:hypothetical protein
VEDEIDELTWARRWRTLERALAHQVANEAKEELRYQATRAYWIARGLAEDAGVSPDQAHMLGQRAATEVIQKANKR